MNSLNVIILAADGPSFGEKDLPACLQILKANWTSANSLVLGFNLVTHFNFFLSITILFLFCTKKDPSKDLTEERPLSLRLEISITLKFFLLFKVSKDSLSNPFARTTSKKFLLISEAIFLLIL